MAFLYPQPSAEVLESAYSEQYYGKKRKKFSGGIEGVIRRLTALKWRRLRPLLGTGGRLLDVGCGRGTMVRLARASGFEAYGVERPYPGAPAMPNVIYGELAECGFPAAHFQVVVLWHVLEHLPDPAAALSEIRRILRPGGWLSVAVPNYGGAQARASGSEWFHLDLPRHLWHFGQSGLDRVLQRGGFQVEQGGTLSLEYDWFGTIQSWMNRAAGNKNRLYALLKGDLPPSWNGAADLATATALAAPALASVLWDAARAQGGTLTVLAQKQP